ncbi:probable ethylene response sensor 1 [Chenopodium quinoa]|uniref:Histidine kinase domain-containing protein n=1 Tax=Chenopodium quinoa TaxID=63459 RepID=A0A803LA25_CHEQI|nr:probable ethylene response sensor 1 [Chenopodium quinoa]
MKFSNCIDEWSTDDFMVQLQHFCDASTAFMHFVIPLELIYFIRMYKVFPSKLAIIYFGTFSILCGVSYLTDLWRYSRYYKYSETSALVIKIVQVCAAVASWLTVVVMYFVTPKFLRIRENVHLLENRVDDLSRKKSLLLRKVATRRSIVNLIDVIRSTVYGYDIVESTLVGLGKIFDLEECSFWFPSHTNKSLQLSHSLNHVYSVGSVVPMNLPFVSKIINAVGAVRIPYTCPLVRANKCTKRAMKFEAVAIRVPLSFSESDDSLNACVMSYAVMVLVLPPDNIRKFRKYELELLGAVVKQVSVALGHASTIEDSFMARYHLKEQLSCKEVGLWGIMKALHNPDDYKTENFNPMEIPLCDVSSFLQDNTSVIFSVETLLQNEKDGMLVLNIRAFHLSEVIKQVFNVIKVAAEVKKLSLSLVLAPDLPVKALGDIERLMQVILIVMGNAVKFTKEGHILVKASVVKPNPRRAWRPSKFLLVSSDTHFYLKVQVEDSGCGIDPKDIPSLFDLPNTSNRHSSVLHGLPICKWLVDAMGGEIWVESDGLGKGCTATIIVALGVFDSD